LKLQSTFEEHWVKRDQSRNHQTNGAWLDVPELGKGKSMTKNGNLMKGVAVALMMVGVVACTISPADSDSVPPQDLVAKNDHAGLETWYMKEAAHLRKRTKDMMAMTEEYKKIPSRPGAVAAKIMLVEHCQTLAANYAKAADEAEMMARAHRDITGRSGS
jgi:hypothetical protein